MGSKFYLCIMSLRVKLSDALVLDARLASEVLERSIAGQVEFCARQGRAIELCGKRAANLHARAPLPLLAPPGAKHAKIVTSL